MFKFEMKRPGGSFCDRLSRRDALRIGRTGMFAGLTLPGLLELQARAATEKKRPRAEACIFLFLEGGPSTIDMWDPKPDAPKEIRGPYKTIPTTVGGTFFAEHCHRCAKIADKFSVVRSHSHRDNGHSTGYHWVMTGRKPDFADGQSSRVPTNVLYPSMGSVVSRQLGPRGAVPAYVNMPDPMSAGGSGFYGAKYAPFVIENDPVQPDFKVRDLSLTDGVDSRRLARRKQMLGGIEKMQRARDGIAGTMSSYYDKAFDLMTSPDAKRAFDLKDEPEKLRRQYGYTSLGQCALLSRRLVEAGCRFVGVDHGSWDTHFSCFASLENDLIPHADMAFSTLITDLEQRGMLDSTLVVMMGEMGRTPRINKRAGRDHWSAAQSVLFAGGGIKPGRVIGATDKTASAPTSDPVGVNDILRTIFTLMGVDVNKTYYTPLGRPVPVVDGGKLIKGLV